MKIVAIEKESAKASFAIVFETIKSCLASALAPADESCKLIPSVDNGDPAAFNDENILALVSSDAAKLYRTTWTALVNARAAFLQYEKGFDMVRHGFVGVVGERKKVGLNEFPPSTDDFDAGYKRCRHKMCELLALRSAVMPKGSDQLSASMVAKARKTIEDSGGKLDPHIDMFLEKHEDAKFHFLIFQSV